MSRVAPWAAVASRLAFAALVLERRRALPRDELAEVLWGEELPRSWESSLPEVLSRVRAALPSGEIVLRVRLLPVPRRGQRDGRRRGGRGGRRPGRGALRRRPQGGGRGGGARDRDRRAAAAPEGDGPLGGRAPRRAARRPAARARGAFRRPAVARRAPRRRRGGAGRIRARAPARVGPHRAARGRRGRRGPRAGDRAARGVPAPARGGAGHAAVARDARRLSADPRGRAAEAPVAGRAAAPAEAVRAVRTILFCDLVGSTETVVAVGDRRWRELLDRHAALVRAHAAEHGLKVVQIMGDGAMLLAEAPGAAIDRRAGARGRPCPGRSASPCGRACTPASASCATTRSPA